MDTLSRDSSSGSSNILTYVGIVLGVIALGIGIVGFAKASKLEKNMAPRLDTLEGNVASVQNDVRNVGTKVDNDIKTFGDRVQTVLNQVAGEIGTMKGQITNIEAELKKRAAPPAAAGKGKKGAAATGTVDADGNYTVAPKDTLNKIAAKFGTTKDAIEAENPGLDPAKLKVGQKIKIPKK